MQIRNYLNQLDFCIYLTCDMYIQIIGLMKVKC